MIFSYLWEVVLHVAYVLDQVVVEFFNSKLLLIISTLSYRVEERGDALDWFYEKLSQH